MGVSVAEQMWGTWWREGAPDNKSDGMLHLADGEFPRLELNHALIWIGEDPSTVHGEVGGRAVSLFDVAVTSQDSQRLASDGSPIVRSTLRAIGGALVPEAAGRHVSGRDEGAFSSALVGVDNLSYWDGRTRVVSDPPTGPGASGERLFKFEVTVSPELVGVFDGVTVATRTRWQVPALGDYRRDDVRIAATFQTVFAVESKDPVSIRRLGQVSRTLSGLVSVGMNCDSRVRGRLRLRVQEDWYELWARPELAKVPETTEAAIDELKEHLFLLSDVADFGQMLGSWATLTAEAPYGVDSVVALLRESATFYENKLMAACNAVEALDRGLHGNHGIKGNGPLYRDRCLKLITIPDPRAVELLVGDPQQWAADMKLARNDLAHGCAPDERKTPSNVWYVLKDRCRAVLALVLMAKLGLSPMVQQQAVTIGGLRSARLKQ